jgi:hypothetical protein
MLANVGRGESSVEFQIGTAAPSDFLNSMREASLEDFPFRASTAVVSQLGAPKKRNAVEDEKKGGAALLLSVTLRNFLYCRPALDFAPPTSAVSAVPAPCCSSRPL